MLKLIVSDVDGTLLRKGEEQINPLILAQIAELKQNGVLFAAASGRPYHELKRLFRSISREIVYIASDGALIMYRERPLAEFPLERRGVQNLTQLMRMRGVSDAVAHGRSLSYYISKNQEFIKRLYHSSHCHAMQAEHWSELPEPLLKLAFYCGKKKKTGGLPFLMSDRATLVYAENGWQEFVGAGVNKGAALQTLCRHFGIAETETAALGDNTNDIEMLKLAGRSYAPQTAKEEVKRLCDEEFCRAEDILQRIIEER